MKVLLLNASHNDLGLIRGLKKLGFYIVVTGNTPGLVGEQYCDKYIRADYSDKELILKISKEEKIDRICACCNDFGVYTASYVAEKLGLPGYDPDETTCAINNKDKFKKLTEELGIISPKTRSFTDIEKAKSFIDSMGSEDYPLIIKPSDASAGNGITKVNDRSEAYEAVSYAFDTCRNGTIVIEQYIEGTQHGFCTFLVDKKVRAICSNNEYSIINPYRVEIDTFPADNWEEASKILIPEIEKIADRLNLIDGIFHLQYIMSDGKPYIIEAMQRAIGNMYSVLADRLNGIEWDYWEAKAKCGISCKDFPVSPEQKGFFAYKSVMADSNGRIDKITIPEEYGEFLFDKCMIRDVGDEITNYRSQMIGLLFFEFPSKEKMKEVLI
ncbi:MAG: ATP-grasp domain-containing protein, partial [Lachnospiraceae bacterium]|nr:ATP-grasp domain-containing protein [Lachnospiraceae bacterium]